MGKKAIESESRCPHHVDDPREIWRLNCPACWGQELRRVGERRPKYRAADEIESLRAQLAEARKVIEAARRVRRGCTCEYDYRCGNCQASINIVEALAAYDAARDGEEG